MRYAVRRNFASGTDILEIHAPYSDALQSDFQRALAEARHATVRIDSTGARSLPPYTMVQRDAALEITFEEPADPMGIVKNGLQLNSLAGGDLTKTKPVATRVIWKAE